MNGLRTECATVQSSVLPLPRTPSGASLAVPPPNNQKRTPCFTPFLRLTVQGQPVAPLLPPTDPPHHRPSMLPSPGFHTTSQKLAPIAATGTNNAHPVMPTHSTHHPPLSPSRTAEKGTVPEVSQNTDP